MRRAAIGASAALGLGATGGLRSSVRAQDATPVTTNGDGDAPGVTPRRVEAAIAQLDDLARQTFERTGIPGMAIAVVYGDELP
jgi:hypothetical protein